MKLVNIVKELLNPELLVQFYIDNQLNNDSEAVLMYMENEINIDSEIIFFDIEETEDDLIFEKNGFNYIQLFPIDYASELIVNDLNLKNKGYSDLEIAFKLLQYRLNDA